MTRQMLLRRIAIAVAVAGGLSGTRNAIQAQADGPSLVDQNLQVRTVASALTTPTSFAFIGPNDLLVLEKNTGRVVRVSSAGQQIVHDLAVNFGSERGLLGIALHPNYRRNQLVYLYYTRANSDDGPG